MLKFVCAFIFCIFSFIPYAAEAKYFGNLLPERPQVEAASFFQGLSDIFAAIAEAERTGGSPNSEMLSGAVENLTSAALGFRKLAEGAAESPLALNQLDQANQARLTSASQFLDVRFPKNRKDLLQGTATCADRVAATTTQFRAEPSLASYLRLRSVMSAAMDFGAVATVLLRVSM